MNIKQENQSRKLFIVFFVFGFLASSMFAKTGYLIFRPGAAENLSEMVTVENGEGFENDGNFYLVTVKHQQASPLLVLYALMAPNFDLHRIDKVIPPDMDAEEYQQMMIHVMEESKNLARVIALRRQGFDVPIESDGVKVVEVGKDSPALGILLPGDIIKSVDGEDVFLAEELVRMVQLRPIGDSVTLDIIRDDLEKTVIVKTDSSPEHQDKAAMRVLTHTLNWQPIFPKEIEIETAEIAGPSAGLMFVLEILNQLNSEDIAAGRKIAGTGTINLREEVGAIGGVRQKVVAAEKAGAEFFLVPLDNYAEAVPAARRIVLVPVGTFDEVMQFLQGL